MVNPNESLSGPAYDLSGNFLSSFVTQVILITGNTPIFSHEWFSSEKKVEIFIFEIFHDDHPRNDFYFRKKF